MLHAQGWTGPHLEPAWGGFGLFQAELAGAHDCLGRHFALL